MRVPFRFYLNMKETSYETSFMLSFRSRLVKIKIEGPLYSHDKSGGGAEVMFCAPAFMEKKGVDGVMGRSG